MEGKIKMKKINMKKDNLRKLKIKSFFSIYFSFYLLEDIEH